VVLRSHRLWSVLGLAVVAAGLAGRVDASLPTGAPTTGIRLLAPPGGTRLTAGEAVVVRWSGLPNRTEEMELLLTLDDGSRTTIRLTGQLAPALDSHLWVVPNLPSHNARIRLRFGVGGEEVETTPGAPFEIVAAAAGPVSELSFAAGEWWLGRVATSNAGCGEPRRTSVEVPAAGSPAEVLAEAQHHSSALSGDIAPDRRLLVIAADRASDPPHPPRSNRPLSAPRRE
jgi:hypothetical protein